MTTVISNSIAIRLQIPMAIAFIALKNMIIQLKRCQIDEILAKIDKLGMKGDVKMFQF